MTNYKPRKETLYPVFKGIQVSLDMSARIARFREAHDLPSDSAATRKLLAFALDRLEMQKHPTKDAA